MSRDFLNTNGVRQHQKVDVTESEYDEKPFEAKESTLLDVLQEDNVACQIGLSEMFDAMETAEVTENINADYIREMIPHHIGAIRMAENALRFSVCPQLVPLLQSIITSQRQGVCEMQRLLVKLS